MAFSFFPHSISFSFFYYLVLGTIFSSELLFGILCVQDTVDTWNRCLGRRGQTTQYQIRLQVRSIVVTAENVNMSACRGEMCSHTLNLLIAPGGSVFSSYDSVSVAAENVVGVGPARTCTAQPISKLNFKHHVVILFTMITIQMAFNVLDEYFWSH